MDASSGLVVERVGKFYTGGVAAVSDLTFEVQRGEILILAGPSGSGKTSTVRLIAGLESVSTGRILIDQQDVTQVVPDERGISMVFQNHPLFPHLRVSENLLFGLRDSEKTPARDRLRETLDLLQIGPLLDRMPIALSGGERQRVALARALLRPRRVALWDEPLSNLDQRLRIEIRQRIKDWVRQTGTMMVYVTHDQADGLALGDRMAILRRGNLEAIGPIREVYSSPASRFVAEFLTASPVAFLTGRMSEGHFRSGAWSVAIPSWLKSHPNAELELGVRASALGAFSGENESCVSVSGLVRGWEFQGDSLLIQVDVLVANLPASGCVLRYRRGAEEPPVVGSHVMLTLDMRYALWFDARTKRLITPN